METSCYPPSPQYNCYQHKQPNRGEHSSIEDRDFPDVRTAFVHLPVKGCFYPLGTKIIRTADVRDFLLELRISGFQPFSIHVAAAVTALKLKRVPLGPIAHAAHPQPAAKTHEP